MTAVAFDTSTHTSVIRIGVVDVRSNAAGVGIVGQPELCRRSDAVHKQLAHTTAYRRGPGVMAGWGGPKRVGRWGGRPSMAPSFLRAAQPGDREREGWQGGAYR